MRKTLVLLGGIILVLYTIVIGLFGIPSVWKMNWNRTFVHFHQDHAAVYFKGSDAQVAASVLPLTELISNHRVARLSVHIMGDGGDGAIAATSQLPDVVELTIQARNVSDDGMIHLLRMKRLEALRIYSPHLSLRGINQLKDIKGLKFLNIEGTMVGNAEAATLERSINSRGRSTQPEPEGA